jgi:hypothetical protein
MRDHSALLLRFISMALAILLAAELVHTAFNARPLAGVTVPAVPTLETNVVATAKTVPPSHLPATNSPGTTTATNNTLVTTTDQVHMGTNAVSANIGKPTTTNMASTNLAGLVRPINGTNQTNVAAMNTAMGQIPSGIRHTRHGLMGGRNFGGPMMGGMMGGAPPLKPEIQARVDQIVNSEIFAPVMHPLPMGLLGIAGDVAFLRTDSGQTGLVKLGDSLGDLKLLRIGINRVLVEQNGEKKELTIFDGYGGDSLLSQQDHTSK